MEGNNNYITKEFYDSNMREFKEAVYASMAAAEARCEKAAAEAEARCEKIVAEIRVENEKMRSEFKATHQRLDNMDRRLDNMEKSQDRFFRNMGFALTGMTLLFTMLQIFLR